MRTRSRDQGRATGTRSMPDPVLPQPRRDAPFAQERARAAQWLRSRFRLARRAGAALALVIIAVRAVSLSELSLRLDGSPFMAFAVLLLSAGGAAPWAVPQRFWRHVYRRKLETARAATAA